MSEEIKNSELNGEKLEKKPFSVNISDEDFAAKDIPAPESEASQKPHKVVRYVEAPKEEKPKAEKKKGGFMGEFIAGAAAGAKSVSEGISAGVKVVSEKKPAEKKAEAPKAEKPVKPAKPAPKAEENDETQFPKDDKPKAKKAPANGGFMAKLNALPTGAIIGGAAVLIVVLVAIILAIATGCAPEDDTPGSEGSQGGIVIGPGSEDNEGEVPEEDPNAPVEVPTRKDDYVEAFNANNDVMGWLYIPGLEDVDAGVCFSYDKSWPYDKRDITGKKVSGTYWIDGAYYTHYRNVCGNTAEELSTNTVIFGHSDLGVTNLAYSNDDPTGPLFSQLFNFKDPDFAQETPYIYLTLPGEDTVWEVFSVFYNDAKALKGTFAPFYKNASSAGDLWYIEPNPTEKNEYQTMLDTIKARSLYDYEVEVNAEDKILTLSTCTVAYGLNARSNYRFVIVAKLVEDPATQHIAKNAAFTINEDAPVPASYKEEFQKYISEWKPAEE